MARPTVHIAYTAFLCDYGLEAQGYSAIQNKDKDYITSMQGQCGHKWEGDDEPVQTRAYQHW